LPASQKYYGYRRTGDLAADLERLSRIPWPETVGVWAVLGLEVLILHALLASEKYRRPLDRLSRAFTVSIIGSVFLAVATPTHARGHYFVPLGFALLAACAFGIAAIGLRFKGEGDNAGVESPKRAG
jgi:hypothetical protein